MPIDVKVWVVTAVIFLILSVPLIYLIRLMYMMQQGVVVIDDADEREEGEIGAACSSCGRPLQEEWRTCPHCGASIDGDSADH